MQLFAPSRFALAAAILLASPLAAQKVSEEQAAASSNPGLRRALALFRLNMRLEGVREWNWALR